MKPPHEPGTGGLAGFQSIKCPARISHHMCETRHRVACFALRRQRRIHCSSTTQSSRLHGLKPIIRSSLSAHFKYSSSFSATSVSLAARPRSVQANVPCSGGSRAIRLCTGVRTKPTLYLLPADKAYPIPSTAGASKHRHEYAIPSRRQLARYRVGCTRLTGTSSTF